MPIMRHYQDTTQKFWEDDVLRKWKKNILFKFVLFSQNPWGSHGILSPHEDGKVHFSGPVGSLCFQMDGGETPSYEGVTIGDFPRRTPPSFSCPIGKCRIQVCKSEFNKLSQITEKFVEPNFIKFLHQIDNLIN